jgi:hypothetical protein
MKEAVVEMVGGSLTLRITADTWTLTPITSDESKIVTEIKIQSFEILGQPGTLVQFFTSGEEVRGLYYEEKRGENEDWVVAIAAPKSLGFPR